MLMYTTFVENTSRVWKGLIDGHRFTISVDLENEPSFWAFCGTGNESVSVSNVKDLLQFLISSVVCNKECRDDWCGIVTVVTKMAVSSFDEDELLRSEIMELLSDEFVDERIRKFIHRQMESLGVGQ